METAIARRTALALLLALPLFSQIRRVRPVDESGRDPSLAAYLTTFKQAVAARDRAALLPLLLPEIKLGFGGDEDGIANFTPDWDALARLLKQGGAWTGDSFAIPYTFVKFPDDLDAFESAVITGSNVRLRANPSLDADILRLMSYEIVKLRNQGDSWWEVDTALGERGYVSADYIASPIGLRAIFHKDERGAWKMFSLVAGD